MRGYTHTFIETFVTVSNHMVPKHPHFQKSIQYTFVTVSNHIVPKPYYAIIFLELAFVTMSNHIVPKPRRLLFSFQQLTINTSSPIVVTRAFACHCGAIQSTILSELLSNKESDDSIDVGLKTSTNERLLLFNLIFFNHFININNVFDNFTCFPYMFNSKTIKMFFESDINIKFKISW